jgi:FHA domain
MDAFANWYFTGFGGTGAWIAIVAIALIAALWLTFDSTHRHLTFARWRVAAWLPFLLQVPLANIELGARGDTPFYVTAATISLVGSALSTAAVVAYGQRFRGLMGCEKGHPPYPARHRSCPVCARQTIPGVPGYAPDLGEAKTNVSKGSIGTGSSQRVMIKVDAWLVNANGSVYQLNMGETAIGRSSKSDIRLWDTSTSRTHARIMEQQGDFTLYDLGSVVGTYVNGERVRRPAKIHDGDVIAFGSGTKMTFSLKPGKPSKAKK